MVTFQRLTVVFLSALAFSAVAQNNDCPHQPWEYRSSTGVSGAWPWHGTRQQAADFRAQQCADLWNEGTACAGVSGNTLRHHTFEQCTLNSSDPGAAACVISRYTISTGAAISDTNLTVGLVRQATVTCPPLPGCDPAFVGVKIASFYNVGIGAPAQVCDTTSGCVAERLDNSGTCGPTQCGFYYKVFGQIDCADVDPLPAPVPENAIIPAPQENCQTIGSAEYCIGSTPDGKNANCGYLNDNWVCVNATPRLGCQTGAGGVVCDAAAGAPPGPDSGTPGVKAAPDGQIKAETGQGNTVNTYNYFNSTTVAGSSRAPATGSPTGGGVGDSNGSGFTGDGEGSEEGEQGGTGSASGGESCVSAPACEGDPIQCAILAQQWRTRCAEASTAAQIQAQAGLSSGEVDGTALNSLLPVVEFGSLSEAGPLGGGSCPPPISFSVKGQSISLDVWRGACDLAALVAPLLMALSYLGAALLIYRGVIA